MVILMVIIVLPAPLAVQGQAARQLGLVVLLQVLVMLIVMILILISNQELLIHIAIVIQPLAAELRLGHPKLQLRSAVIV